MRILTSLLGAMLGLAALSAQAPSIAFVNVSVVPMDREVVLRDHTVVVTGDVIAAIGPSASVKPPAGATVVDGRGKFLMPGLAEMHGHLTGPNEALNERILLLSVSRGITTVRGMLGHPSHLVLRERVRKGELLGPTIYTSGPSLNGNTVPDAATAEKLVAEQKAAGYDLLKIHPGIARGPFDALAATATKVGIPFAGHVPIDVGVHRAIEAGYASIDHLDGYVEALLRDGAPVDAKQPGFFGLNFVGHLDESRIQGLVAKTKAAGVWNVPTQSLMPAFMGPESTEALVARPEMKYLPKQMVDNWAGQRNKFIDGLRQSNAQGKVAEFMAVRSKIIKALDDADTDVRAGGTSVPPPSGILLGADTPQVMQVPGWATHGELQSLVAAGLSPYRALRAGTINVARYFRTEARTGTLQQGKEASAILVDGNPLDDVANAWKISGVLVRGTWLPKAEIDQKLAALPPM
jgi:imidazolonepropionase-like amidohydrolase